MKKTTLLVSIAALVAGCSTAIIRPKVEKGIRERLPQYLGEAEAYRVSVKGPDTSIIGGKIESLHIEGDKVELSGMVFDKLTIDVDDVRFNPHTRHVKSVGNAVFSADISSHSINSYIRQHRDDADSISVEIDGGEVLVNAVPKMIGINVPVSIKGRPIITDGTKVEFKADSAALSVMPIPAFIVNAIISRINPVFDASQVRIPITIETIAVGDQYVTISGRANIGAADLPV